MGLTTIVQTIDDLDVSPGSGYSAVFLQSFEQPGSSATFVETAYGPTVTHIAAGMYRLSALSIFIEEGDETAMQVALMRALDTTRAAKSIVISDSDGGNRRYLLFVTEALNQQPETAGLAYIATLIAHEDIRWRSAPDITETFNMTATGWKVITVGGHLTAYPTLTITPQAPKSAPGWQYAVTKVVRWVSPLSTHNNVPIDITGGGWNTAALVTSGQMTTRYNIAVLDGYGRFVPHWYGDDDGQPGGFNSTTTKIWINAADFFIPHEALYLGTELPAGSELMNAFINTQDVTAIPPAGWLRFTDTGEIISYNGVERGTLMEMRRGVAGTTRADHTVGVELEGGIKPFQIIWDPASTVPTSAKTPAYRADEAREPLIDKAASTNSFWRMTQFRSGSRSRAWGFTGSKDQAYTKATDSSGVVAGFSEPWTALGYRNDIAGKLLYWHAFPMPITTVRLLGRQFGNGYPYDYPYNAQFKIMSSATRSWAILWDSTNTAIDDVPYDKTLTTPMVEIADRDADLPLAEWPTLYNELLWSVQQTNGDQIDIQQVDVTFTTGFTPIIETYTPATTYDLTMLVWNYTTGDGLSLFMPGVEIGQSVVINAVDDTVIYTGDNSNKYAGCRKTIGDGAFLMTLEPGDNSFYIAEDHMTDVDFEIRYAARYYV